MTFLLDFFIFFLFLVAAFGYGGVTLHILGRMQLHLSNTWSTYLAPILGLGVIALLTFFIGLVGGFYSIIAWILLLIGVASALILLPWLINVIRQRVHRVELPGSIKSRLEWLAFGLLIAFCLIGPAYSLFVNALMPPIEWDELAYHLALPAIYTRDHFLTQVPFIFQSYWPLNTEMLFTQGLLLGSEQFSHLITWWMSLWTALGISLLAGHHRNKWIGLLAAFIYLQLPLVIRLSGTGLNETAMAFFSTAIFITYFGPSNPLSRPALLLCGLFAGFVAGIKFTGLAFLGFIPLLILWDSIRLRLDWQKLVANQLYFIIPAVMIASPWYLRSAILTGNPIYPFAYSIFKGSYWDAEGVLINDQLWRTIFEPIPRTGIGLLLSLKYLIFEPHRLGGYYRGFGQFLPISFLVSLLIQSINFRGNKIRLWQLAILTIGFYILWFLTSHTEARYLFPIIPAVIIITIHTMDDIMNALQSYLPRMIFVGLLIGCLFYDWPFRETTTWQHWETRLSVLTNSTEKQILLNQYVDILPAFQYINTQLPAKSKILLLPYENRTYYLQQDYVWGHPGEQRIIPFEKFFKAKDLANALRSKKITHILDNTTWMYTGLKDWDRIRNTMLEVEQSCAIKIKSWDKANLYEITTCREGEAY